MSKNLFLYLILAAAALIASLFTMRLSGYSRDDIADIMRDGIVAYADKDYDDAFSSFEKATAMGNAQAAFILGNMYMNGFGTQKDEARAVSLYQIAADALYTPALYTLAIMHMDGSVLPKNVKKSQEYLTIAAQNGDAEAMATLALWFERGLFGQKDPEKAVFWYNRAARAGNTAAQTALSFFYAQGMHGLPIDYRQSHYWSGVLEQKKQYIRRFSGQPLQQETFFPSPISSADKN